MRYNFNDTPSAAVSTMLPAEAMMIGLPTEGGFYIENEIEGYSTLAVQGREAMSVELTTADAAKRNGKIYQGKKYPEREITVTYQLICTDDNTYRAAFNRLNQLLNFEQMPLVFADEPDKYFVGTLAESGEIEPGKNAVTGELKFICSDPFKYSVSEYEAVPDSDGILAVNYDGTFPAYPVLEADFYQSTEADNTDGNCGYVAFINQNEKIIQLGDPEEAAGQKVAEQVLINREIKNGVGNYTLNNGVVESDYWTQAGTVKRKPFGGQGAQLLCADTYGVSGTTYTDGVGPTVTIPIPQDSFGDTGASDFELTWNTLFSPSGGTAGLKQHGDLQVIVSDTSNRVIAGVTIRKVVPGTAGYVGLFVNNKTVKDYPLEVVHDGGDFGTVFSPLPLIQRWSTIVKDGGRIIFHVGPGRNYAVTIPELATREATKITLAFNKYGRHPAMDNNGIAAIKFKKNNCNALTDRSNTFTSNDIVIADTSNAEIYLTSAGDPSGSHLRPDLGALGNDWEDFVLTPGLNQIRPICSDWVDSAKKPTYKMRYRKVYL